MSEWSRNSAHGPESYFSMSSVSFTPSQYSPQSASQSSSASSSSMSASPALSLSSKDFPALPSNPSVPSSPTRFKSSAQPAQRSPSKPARQSSPPPQSPPRSSQQQQGPQVIRMQQPQAQAQAQQPSQPSVAATPLDPKYSLAGMFDPAMARNPDYNLLSIGKNFGQIFGQQEQCSRYPDTRVSALLKTEAQPQKPGNADVYSQVCGFQVEKVLQQNIPDDVLFYMFYAMPRDQVQVAAAKSLAERGWVYHLEMQTWLRPCPDGEPPHPLQDGWERGSWLYFDVKEWTVRRKDDLVLSSAKLMSL